MSTGTRRICLAAMACCCSVVSATAGTIEVLSLGIGRGYDNGGLFQMVMTGTSMDTVRAALVADGVQFTAGESFTAADLAGYDVVLLGLFDPAEALTTAERNAVDAFVRGGGALVYMGDNDRFATPNQSVAGIFGVVYGNDPATGSATNIPDPHHAIIDGPAGLVTEYDGSGNTPGFFGGIVELGAYAQSVLGTDHRTVVAAIERGALDPTSGPVVFISEINGFVDEGLGTVNLADNLVLMRNIFAFVAGGCAVDADCQDGVFCNGAEQCIDQICAAGTFPCPPGEGCHEDLNTCGPCTADEQCDDGMFCNGEETCDILTGVCQGGTFPCAPGEGCHENTDTCGPCTTDEQCHDFVFCNGVETCDVVGVCQPGPEPCQDDCEYCDEESASCLWCIFDLDRDGVIGTGDFAFFSGCFGDCYPPDDPCAAANFDGDPDNCVGSGDFAGFSGCFGLTCAECDACVPTARGELRMPAAPIDGTSIKLLALSAPSATDTLSKLPGSRTFFEVDRTFYLEVWVARPTTVPDGLTSVYVNLSFDPAHLAVKKIIPSAPFATLPLGEVDAEKGVIRSVGGCAAPGDATVGVRKAWARVVTLRMQVVGSGRSTVTAGPADTQLGIGVFGEFETIDPSRVYFGKRNLSFAQRRGSGPGGQSSD